MGRPPKSTADLKLHGGFRPDRHGDRADLTPPQGGPIKPDDLTDDENELWDQVIAEHKTRGTLGTVDTSILRSLCEFWGLLRQTMPLAKQYPTDKETRCALVAYAAEYQRLAVQLGVGPVARAKLKIPKQEGPKAIPARNRA